jgi:hypothetical protein
MQRNYKYMHLKQFKEILEMLLKNKIRLEEINTKKITEK